MKKIILIAILLLSIIAIGCNSKNASNKMDSSSEIDKPKYSKEVQKAIDEISKGNYGEASHILYQINQKEPEEDTLEYQLSQYDMAMYSLYKNRIEGATLENKLEWAKKYLYRIRENYDGPFAEDIKKLKQDSLKRQPEVGMSLIQLYFAIGAPDDVNTTKTEYGNSEQFIYRENSDKNRYKDMYVYLEDGKVTAIQN